MLGFARPASCARAAPVNKHANAKPASTLNIPVSFLLCRPLKRLLDRV
jgi:hypothetical protein